MARPDADAVIAANAKYFSRFSGTRATGERVSVSPMTEEEAINANLLPCINGPISNAAEGDMVSGRASRYASTRANLARVIEAHRHRTGRPPKANFDERARVHNLILDSMACGHTHEFAIRQARAKTTLDDGEFADASKVKPSWEVRKRAKELRGVRNFHTPLRDSQPTRS